MLEPKEEDDEVDGAAETAVKDQPQISSPGIILKKAEVQRFKLSTTHR